MSKITPTRKCYACIKENKTCDICFQEKNKEIHQKMVRLKILESIPDGKSYISILNYLNEKEYYLINYDENGIPFNVLMSKTKPNFNICTKIKHFFIKKTYQYAVKKYIKNTNISNEITLEKVVFSSFQDNKNLTLLQEKDLNEQQRISSQSNFYAYLSFVNFTPLIHIEKINPF